jgi:hypothetical protein
MNGCKAVPAANFHLINKAVFTSFVANWKWLISAPGCSLSAGRAVSLLAPLGVSPVTLIPQESRTLRFNQLINEAYAKRVLSNRLLEKRL